jgi:hypothetical protein
MPQLNTETIFQVAIISTEKDQPIIIENNSIESLVFVEDIFSSLNIGILEFTDRGGAVEALPIIGKELIYLSYSADSLSNGFSGTRTKFFMVHDVDFKSDIDHSGSAITKVVMKLVDAYYYRMNSRRYSYSWEDKCGSDIIKDICNNYIGSTEYPIEIANKGWEDSSETIGYPTYGKNKNYAETHKAFVMPYWTPTETIRWLLKRMVGSKSNQPGYLFYNNINGFNLVTIPYLLNSNENYVDPEKYFFANTKTTEYFNENRILSGRMYPPSNQAVSYLAGSTLMSTKFEGKDMRELNDTGNMANEQYKANFHGSTSLYGKLASTTNDVSIVGGEYSTLNTLYRNSWIKRYMKQLQMEIVLKGSVRRYAGMLIDLEWVSFGINSTNQNKMYKGRYLVKSVQHMFLPKGQPAYKQILRIAKTAFEDTVVT